MSRVIATAFAAVAWVATLGASAIRAHEGHGHGPQPSVRIDAAPRGQASSALFELVAIAQGEELVIYIDRFATNEPVRDAAVEVETPAGPATAAASDDAYRLKAPWLAKPGHVDLIVTLTVGADTDILPVSIDIPDRAAAAQQSANRLAGPWELLQPATGFAAGLGFIVGVVLMSLRRRPHREDGKHGQCQSR